MHRLTFVFTGMLLSFVAARSAAAQGTGLESALHLLERLDEIQVSADFDRRPLGEVVEELGRASRVDLVVDWKALQALGIRARDPLTLQLRPAPMSTVLSALLLTIGDDFARPVYEVHAGAVVITSIEGTAPMRLTDVYDVRDILADERTVRELRGGGPEPVKPEVRPDDEPDDDPDGDPDGDPGDAATAPERISPGLELLYMIVEHVDPEAWIDFGGARSRITERDGVLVVSTGATTHQRLRSALSRLRSANPSGVRLQASMVDLPSERWGRLLGRYPAGSRALAAAVLRDVGATVTWRATVGGRFDTPMEVESVGDDRTVRLVVTPRRGETGVVDLVLDAESLEGTSRHAVKTTIALAPQLGAAVVEMPVSGDVGETRRLLVLVPDRL
jgi:hypothetical protein